MSLCSTPRCPCSENPFANLSSERPDRPIFVGMSWQEQVPFLGANWSASQCNASFFSSVSQQDADLQAAVAAQNCIPLDCVGRCCPCTSEDPNCDPCACPEADPATCHVVPRFCNVLQGCQGGDRTAVIVPCTVVAHSQADADAIAASICQEIIRTGGGTPNVPNCPVITGLFPPSPISANEGETVVISASVSYTGSGPLTFLWFLNGFPLISTPNSILTLANVSLVDSGDYVLQVSAPGCASVYSPSLTLDVVSGCVEDFGPPPPTGLAPFEIAAEVEWETFQFLVGSLTDIVSSVPACNPTGWSQFVWGSQPDHPPGNYQVGWVSGFMNYVDPVPDCGGPFEAEVTVYQLNDAEHDYDHPVACLGGGPPYLTNILQDALPAPPSGSFGSGITGICNGTAAGMEAFVNTVFNPGPTTRRWTGYPDQPLTRHSNTGGSFKITFPESVVSAQARLNDLAGHQLTLKIIQADGLIQQPRKLAITDWATVAANLPNSVALNWNGHLDTRTTYDGVNLQWDAPASGAFGGAVCRYSQAHPTSPNGCGWILEIYSAPAVLEWRGFKVVNDTGDGNYILEAGFPSTLGCIELFDNT